MRAKTVVCQLGLVALALSSLTGCMLDLGSLQDDYYHPTSQFRRKYLAEHPELPLEVRHAIATQTVRQGMTPLQVLASLGPPVACNRPLGIETTRTVCLYKKTSRTLLAGFGETVRHTVYGTVLFEEGQAIDWQVH